MQKSLDPLDSQNAILYFALTVCETAESWQIGEGTEGLPEWGRALLC